MGLLLLLVAVVGLLQNGGEGDHSGSGVAGGGVSGTVVMVVVIMGMVGTELLLVVGDGGGDVACGDGSFGFDGGDDMN